MWIESVEVQGFLNAKLPIRAIFNRDINIVTGRNGAGKTSLLKLIWYIMSGNILEALREVVFSKVTLATSEYTCVVHRISDLNCRVEVIIDGETTVFQDLEDEDGSISENAEDMAAEVLTPYGSSVFLPTFRRIEGGFTLKTQTRRTLPSASRHGFMTSQSKVNAIEEALDALSRNLSNGNHKFVAAISTSDIVKDLQVHYQARTEAYNTVQSAMSQRIVDRIKSYQITGEVDENTITAASLLSSIRSQIEEAEAEREKMMVSFSAIQRVVQSLFVHKGIKVGRLSFGDATAAISSDSLSAGEKQMLSFISYNGLSTNSSIFVDEPELSLHVDWQRSLFAILQRQQATNQFIIATHSPFIYSKYADKEILIDTDRGDSEVSNA